MTTLSISHLAEKELQRIVLLREAWTVVGKAFSNGSPHCDSCGFKRDSVTRVPYGDTRVDLPVHSDCTLGWAGYHRPEMCAAYVAHLQALEEAALDAEEPPIPCPECGGEGIRDGVECANCDGFGSLDATSGEPVEGAKQ